MLRFLRALFSRSEAPNPHPYPNPHPHLEQARALVARVARTAYVPRVRKLGAAEPLPLSRFGGLPLLRPDEPWPTCGCGSRFHLLLQLASTDLPASAEPTFAGLLQLFHCCTGCHEGWQPFSGGNLARILPLSSDLRLPQAAPDDTAFPPVAILGWDATMDLPTVEEAVGMNLGLTAEHKQALYDTDEFQPLDGEKLLGYPHWIQGVEYPACPRCRQDMRHLFQIDSERNIPYMFGDAGIGHITICPTHPDILAFGWACG